MYVEIERKKGSPSWSSSTWKYWSTFKTKEPVAGIRGYVTSSGTPSIDLDIPINARLPVLMIRECRDTLLEPELGEEFMSEFVKISELYELTLARDPGVKNSEHHRSFYSYKSIVF